MDLRTSITALPDGPGVYRFYDRTGRLLYVGKAGSLRKRVASYARSPRELGPRVTRLVSRIHRVETTSTGSEEEALLLEARLIKAHQPRYNVALRDDKHYPSLKLTIQEPFPRLLLVRRRQDDGALYYGPFTDVGLLRQALQLMRRTFPLRTCRRFPDAPCLEYYIGQCQAPCVGKIDRASYDAVVRRLRHFLEGRRDLVLRELTEAMQTASRAQHFEAAAQLRDQLMALSSVVAAQERSKGRGPLEQLQLLLRLPQRPERIETYDISNIQGEEAVGALVTFVNGQPRKADYRKFKIRETQRIDDYRMMAEVIRRRFTGSLAAELPRPDLLVIDGGKGHLATVRQELEALHVEVSAIAIAKVLERIFVPGRREPVVLLPTSPVLHLIQRMRDEAHRFAITYHRRLRRRTITGSVLDGIPGIGPQRKQRLLRHFPSLARLRAATTEELTAIPTIGPHLAHVIAEGLQHAPAPQT